MDGKPTKLEIPKLGRAEQACVDLLEQVLVDAKAGMVTTVGIISCGPSAFGSAHAGPDAAKLNLGLDVLKRTVLDIVSPPVARGSAILRR